MLDRKTLKRSARISPKRFRKGLGQHARTSGDDHPISERSLRRGSQEDRGERGRHPVGKNWQVNWIIPGLCRGSARAAFDGRHGSMRRGRRTIMLPPRDPLCRPRASRSSAHHPTTAAATPSPHPTVRVSKCRAPRRWSGSPASPSDGSARPPRSAMS